MRNDPAKARIEGMKMHNRVLQQMNEIFAESQRVAAKMRAQQNAIVSWNVNAARDVAAAQDDPV